jgi:hypothetical protein
MVQNRKKMKGKKKKASNNATGAETQTTSSPSNLHLLSPNSSTSSRVVELLRRNEDSQVFKLIMDNPNEIPKLVEASWSFGHSFAQVRGMPRASIARKADSVCVAQDAL